MTRSKVSATENPTDTVNLPATETLAFCVSTTKTERTSVSTNLMRTHVLIFAGFLQLDT